MTEPAPWRPAPVAYAPVFVWPPRPRALLRWLPHFVFPTNAIVFVIAVALWTWATPATETMTTLEPGWVGFLLVRNLVVVAAVYGATHWWVALRRSQGEQYKFNPSWPRPRAGNRTFGNQTRENVFWTLASAVPIGTAWEATTLWLFSSGRIGWLDWAAHPVWFVALFPATVLLRELHFYAVHRLIHVRALYRRVHSLHHRNTNPGPWSGMSMHPLEHIVYFSSIALHWVVLSHPVHAVFNMVHLNLAPIPGHVGFEYVELGRYRYPTNGHAHYLHHSLFEVNYADGVFPLDRWFGSFHDGSPDSDARLAARRRSRTG
ncbi:MAG: sterol desaturase family protein [Acidimicrobiales bacterium]